MELVAADVHLSDLFRLDFQYFTDKELVRLRTAAVAVDVRNRNIFKNHS